MRNWPIMLIQWSRIQIQKHTSKIWLKTTPYLQLQRKYHTPKFAHFSQKWHLSNARKIEGLHRIFNLLRDILGRLETLLPKHKLVQHVKVSYIEGLLDEASLNRWNATRQSTASYESIMQFIQHRLSLLFQPITLPPICKICLIERHWPFKCAQFRMLTMPQRIDYVRHHKLCTNCFSEKHSNDDCMHPPWPCCSSLHLKLYHNSALCAGNSSIACAGAATGIESIYF